MKRKDELRENILTALSDRGLPIQEMWPGSLPDSLPAVIKFVDSKSNRILTVEEFDDFEFDYVIRRTGIDFDQFDLLIRFKNISDNLNVIAEIYKVWFIDLGDIDYLDEFLSGFI